MQNSFFSRCNIGTIQRINIVKILERSIYLLYVTIRSQNRYLLVMGNHYLTGFVVYTNVVYFGIESKCISKR